MAAHYVEVVVCTLCLASPLAYSETAAAGTDSALSGADSGMINRTPLISSAIAPDNLDSLSTSIGSISASLSEILAEPEEQITATTEADDSVLSARPLVPQPEAVAVVKIETNRPETTTTKPPAAPKKTAAETKKPSTNRYLKLGADGKPLPDDAAIWACVQDSDNGLIWEVKSSDGSLHDKNNSYSWFQPASNEAFQGVANGGQCKGNAGCDTQSYAQAVNARSYCGYSDWRLPTREEMLSIVNFEKISSTVLINRDYFPETLPSWYWTASTNENHPEHAWYVLFRNGIAINDLKARPKHIRLVRNQTDKG